MSRPEAPTWMGEQDERLLPLVTVVPYVMLAALTVVTLIVKWGTGSSLLIDLGLCAAVALWILCMFSLRRDRWERAWVMGVFFAGLVVLTGILVVRDPWFGLFTPAGYFYAFGILPWPWRLCGIAAVALESGSAQVAGTAKDSAAGVTVYVVVLAVNVICMCGWGWWQWDADRKNEERKAALEQVREANRRLKATLAENAGLQRQLLVQSREAGVLDERQRMAREIHDTLAQGLIGIVTQLQAAEQLAEQSPDRWRAHFEAATRLARESLAEARRSVDALRPRPLETAGLGEALAGVAERWSALHGVTVEVTTTGTARPMPPEAELALLRAAQEALANVGRHARAGTVALTLGYLDREVTLEVCDDGCGFDPSAARVSAPVTAAPVTVGAEPAGAAGGGFGLKAMRERIEELSGTVRVRSRPGSGTTVSARVPHPSAEVGA
ncbi:sensor histidine kinase [Kitasatospora sp. NBC_01287]|uniref:sensor histidine kinase n=1 Tax=Kitasatospora sp. NBC_01287 TaxID=2903573 RepID=UPI00224F4CB2|nr:sensor histidine kinase [Kitasatospora sp. NBC_01287]MCX4751533.1 sensor histidine kinase [Kitasatospora sp. NBC_01287]